MKRSDLVRDVRALLARAGFLVSDWGELRPVGFDLVARRDDKLLIVKVLNNVDSLNERVANELKVLGRFLNASPVLVGDHSSSHPLDQGVVYARQGIPVVAVSTLRDLLMEGVPPFVYSAPGGYYVRIDGETLRRVREERGLSLGDLADVARSSRRTISMYEEGMSAMVDAALRLEEFLGIEIIEPIDVTDFEAEGTEPAEWSYDGFGGFERTVVETLLGVGLDVVPTTRSPFQALTVDEEFTVLTGMDDRARRLAIRARLLSNLSEITERSGVFFVSSSGEENVEGTPVVTQKDLRRLADRDELFEMIDDRSE